MARMSSAYMQRLRSDGIARIPVGLGRDQAKDIATFLRGCWCYPGHVRVYGDGVARTFQNTRRMFDVWCHDMSDVIRAPHVWDLVMTMVPTAAGYLGVRPRLYSLNAFWARPSDDGPYPALQAWHRDADDDKFVAMFLYGTEVQEPADGPHFFVPGSHLSATEETSDAISICGPAGTVFVADTSGLHYGAKPTRGDRLLLWARWGVSDRPRSYDIDRLQPADRTILGSGYPQDAETQDLIRLVVQ